MRYKHRLRSRLIATFLVFVTLFSGVFAVSVLGMRDYLEDELIGDTLEANLDEYLEKVIEDPTYDGGFARRMDGYVVRPGRTGKVPDAFEDLPTGVHDVDTGDASYKVAVQKLPMVWGYLAYDITPNERAEWLMLAILAGGVLVFAALAVVLAFWISSRVIAPVTDLAHRISHLGQYQPTQRLAAKYADDEVGQLAAALDAYAERLTSLVERDKEFNANVSHELRTPLAVIRSATELLLAQPDVSEKTKTRLTRIERAARQSSELTTALLHLVRDQRDPKDIDEEHAVEDLIEGVVDSHRPQLGRKPVEVEIVVESSVRVRAPEPVLAVALGNLVGNAFKYTAEGQVTVRIGGGRVLVEDTGPGIQDADMPHVFDRHYRGQGAGGKGSGLGLAIVHRLCELYGWSVRVTQRADGAGLAAELQFTPVPGGGGEAGEPAEARAALA